MNETLAKQADRYELYELSVQHAPHEVKLFILAYQHCFAQAPKVLREDFCGTHAVCHAWIESDPERVAIGIDLDPEPIAWGRKKRPLSAEAETRLTLLEEDVLMADVVKADVVAAQNFSYNFFHDRATLLRYFKAAYQALGEQGIFVLDTFGGAECYEEHHLETREVEYPENLPLSSHIKTFTYEWEQMRFDPITHHTEFHINFEFKDGSRMERAFTYPWRLWTIPELREVLAEAGFAFSEVWWDTDKEDHDGFSMYAPTPQGSPDPAWVAYVVGVKHK